ncbi:MAG TPA: divergent polysaccharide deacetylase family protein [Candidatus Saccharimonadaceae bacterium]|jgi:polysaccharide deacetylase 2 family uncharacterized protein YibQ|nr:divergent polysaccharide deacetylase family protein [Candidatus Saccharimonadaceae bacterium]
MPKRKSKPSWLSPRPILLLAGAALLLFAAGEGWRVVRSDSGRVLLAARFGLGDPARVTQIVGREARAGLSAAGVAPDSIQERMTEATPRVRWRVGLKPEASLLQANYAISHRVEEQGGTVMSGRERSGAHGETAVTLLVGVGHHATHEITLVHMPRVEGAAPSEPAKLALLLYGFADDGASAAAFDVPVPFAVAIAPGMKHSAELFHAAHRKDREVVLHLPLEPINYPQVNPGPGTVLVTMNDARITGLVRRHFDQAGSVVAVANLMGSLATQDMSVMTSLYHELARRHTAFLHVDPAAGSVCKRLSAELGVMYDTPDVVLDAETRGPTTKLLDARWSAALKQARARGNLLVMIRVSPQVLAWLPKATTAKRLDGIGLVPLTAVLKRPATL